MTLLPSFIMSPINGMNRMQVFLTYSDIALASGLIIIVLLISWQLRLKLTSTLLMAAVRTIVQLYRSDTGMDFCP